MKEELEKWESMLKALQAIPHTDRSRNHTEYLLEVEGRVYEAQDAILYESGFKKLIEKP